MPRYLKVRGKPGALVQGVGTPEYGADHTARRRYVGKQEKPDTSGIEHHVDRFVDVDQIVEDDAEGHIRKACKDGDLELIGKCVAKDFGEAAAMLNKPIPKSKSGGDA